MVSASSSAPQVSETDEERERAPARLGSTVLIDLNQGDRLTFARLHPSAHLKVGNAKCCLSPLIDAAYGSAFEVQKGSLVRISHPLSAGLTEAKSLLQDPHDDSAELEAASGRDNRSLVDDNTAQKLSSQDIDRMRADCATGRDIVDALIANSSTFHGKTAYSQEKYRRKKQKKYAPFLVIQRPSARRICEAYAAKNPAKINFLRMDTMAMMLSLGNVGAHAEVLVMDMASGLLTAAAAERIGGFGSICSVYCGTKAPPLDIVGLLNLTPAMASRVFRVSLWYLTSFVKGDVLSQVSPPVQTSVSSYKVIKHPEGCLLDDDNQKCIEAVDGTAEHSLDVEAKLSMCTEGNQKAADGIEVTNTPEDTSLADENEKDHAKKSSLNAARYCWKPDAEDLAYWAKHGFTGLLVGAPEYEPWSAVHALLPLLSPSSPFAIYHRYLQPLAECLRELQVNKMAIALEIIEPWLREYQVRPSQTHPQMQMNATGGYILTGIKIASI